ncbi:MAG: thiosulfate oxidation carrier protein SoxY [Alphaproteobacteria bacterium]|nr:MAG: thiosulfate oxidation carrier protein SoxY [Alphaproteobacteria bacterium]
MTISRREALLVGAGGLVAGAAVALPLPVMAAAEDAIAAFTGGAEMAEGGITLDAPEIAENGNTVPVGFDAPGAVEVAIFALGNPNPEVAVFKFGPMAGSQSAKTRIRLAKTQDVVAVAKMADGSFASARRAVKVTIGGCGG